MLSLHNVSAGYNGVNVVNNISFDLKKNENLCILGPNGCGKTTLIKAIAGLIPVEGKILLDNENMFKMKRQEIAKKVAVLGQISFVYFSYTVFETVLLGRYLHMKENAFKEPSKYDKEYAHHCIEAVGLSNLEDRQISTLSGGQLQRVFLARTLAQDPKIILLDEPTNHLDLKNQAELVEYLNEWSKTDDHSVIGVLHDINLANRLANKVLFLNDGKMVAYGKNENVINPDLLNNIYGMDVVSYMIDSLKVWESFKYNSHNSTKLRKVL